MNEKVQRFLREQTRVRTRQVLGPIVLVILSAALVVPLLNIVEQKADAQSQQVPVPSQAQGVALLASGTTDLTATIFNLVRVTTAATPLTPDITGDHSIYGWSIFNGSGSSPCYIQIFDRYPTTSITVGTTLPSFAMPIYNLVSTPVGSVPSFYMSPYPLFHLTSGFGVVATTTRNGNTICTGGGGVTATFFYK